jgi:hypothetical protein
MKNVLMAAVVVVALVGAGTGGAFAGFVDTEVSEDNYLQAGMMDLLVNGMNDPDLSYKLRVTCVKPCVSQDFWVDVFNWGECTGGTLYLHFKDVESIEDGKKEIGGVQYVYDGVAPAAAGIPAGYRAAVGPEPAGPGVWSTEPEKISEVGDGLIAQYYIAPDDPNLLGEDYASGIADHLGVHVLVPLIGADGDELGNPDTNGDGEVDDAEEVAWTAAGNRWVQIIFNPDSGKLVDIECHKAKLGFMPSQRMSFIHIDVHLQQIWAEEWYDANGVRWDQPGSAAAGVDYDGDGDVDGDDFQKAVWPSNALQGDSATWSMLFELTSDP